MTETKPFWLSITFWGVIFTAVGQVLPMLGVGVSASDVQQFSASFTNALNSILTFGGMLIALLGRFHSTKEITLRDKRP